MPIRQITGSITNMPSHWSGPVVLSQSTIPFFSAGSSTRPRKIRTLSRSVSLIRWFTTMIESRCACSSWPTELPWHKRRPSFVVKFDLDTRIEYSILAVSGNLLTQDVGYYNLTGEYVVRHSLDRAYAIVLLVV